MINLKTTLAVLIGSAAISTTAFANPPGSGTTNGNDCVENCGNGGGNGGGGNGGNGGNGGGAVSTNTNSNSNTSNSTSTSSGGNADSSSSSTSNGGAGGSSTSSVSVEGDASDPRGPASSAYAPSLAASAGTCSGSSTAGAQTFGFGLSLGSTWTDKGCDLRRDVSLLIGMGRQDIAMAMLCEDREFRIAIENAGEVCPGDVFPEDEAEEKQEPRAATPRKTEKIYGAGNLSMDEYGNLRGGE